MKCFLDYNSILSFVAEKKSNFFFNLLFCSKQRFNKVLFLVRARATLGKVRYDKNIEYKRKYIDKKRFQREHKTNSEHYSVCKSTYESAQAPTLWRRIRFDSAHSVFLNFELLNTCILSHYTVHFS